MLRGRSRVRDLALRTGGPLATVTIRPDGTILLTWTNDAMAQLLGLGRGGSGRRELTGLLAEDGEARLSAAGRDLVRLHGQVASAQVSIHGHGLPEQVWCHLTADRPGPVQRLLRSVGLTRTRWAVLHAERSTLLVGAWTDGAPQGRDHLVDRLGAALRRTRRHRSRVVLAVASVLSLGEDGMHPATVPVTSDLADRVRQAARDTDTVVPLAPGWLAVLAEQVQDDGEIALARRILAVLHDPTRRAPRPVVAVAVLEVADPAADPDAVVTHLMKAAAPTALGGGLTVLDPWRADAAAPRDRPGAPDGPVRGHLDRALRSGQFVLACRQVLPMRQEPAGSAVPRARITVAEVCTVDEGIPTPVRVDAPGLAGALDRWALERAAALDAGDPGSCLVVRLQPGGRLTSSLRQSVSALAGDRPGTVVVQVPEGRLAAGVSAQRAVLRDLSATGARLGVAAWSGRIDVRTLVRWQVRLVELSPSWLRDVLHPDGLAAVTALTAGLRAGLGHTAVVVAERPADAEVRDRLTECGVCWAIPSRAGIMGAA